MPLATILRLFAHAAGHSALQPITRPAAVVDTDEDDWIVTYRRRRI